MYNIFPVCIAFFSIFEEWNFERKNVTGAWDNKGNIIIGNAGWIRYEAVILTGMTIGDGAIIVTRAVVTKDVLLYTIVDGIPAKQIKNDSQKKRFHNY